MAMTREHARAESASDRGGTGGLYVGGRERPLNHRKFGLRMSIWPTAFGSVDTAAESLLEPVREQRARTHKEVSVKMAAAHSRSGAGNH